jgi:hypothetical protein
MEARKLETWRRKLDGLQERKAEGKCPLSKAEELELKTGMLHINYAPVWVKLQSGIGRCTLDTDPLTRDEEEQVQSAEERLRAIKLLEDKKARGEWLTRLEMAEVKNKGEIQSSPLMMRVRKGAPRYAPGRALQAAPVPKAFSAPAPAPAPVSNPSPAPVETRAPVPQASKEALPVPTPAVLVVPAPAAQDDAVSEASTKSQQPKLKDMVATIREQLDIEDSFTTPAQVIAEANRQLDLQATGTILEQARSLLGQITEPW